MSDSTIGIKIADGSYYPILEQGFTGRKKLTVTTAKNNQDKVKIDLYRGSGASLAEASFVGSLVVENIPPAAQGAPEIELLLSLDEQGQLSAEANDARTGESQRFATTLAAPAESETFSEPELVMDEADAELSSLEEPALTGEAYPVGEKDRREEVLHRRTPNIILLVLFVVLGVALVAAVAYFVYRAIQGPAVPALSSSTVTVPAASTAQQSPAPAATPQASSQTTAQTAAPTAMTAQPAPAMTAPVKQASYLIKRGDTLWDISATYYRNPWLYPKLATANSIKNPDLIFAGTRIIIPEN